MSPPMRASVLFSAGKDSSLAAIMLRPYYEVELVTVSLGVSKAHRIAQGAARILGLPHRVVELPVAEEAVRMAMEDGYPRNAIDMVHREALELVASQSRVVADGTRRDDRAPRLSRGEARSLEDRHNVQYLRPLMGYGRPAVDYLVDRLLVVEEGEDIEKADYEADIRELMRREHGQGAVEKVFPRHTQSRIKKVKSDE